MQKKLALFISLMMLSPLAAQPLEIKINFQPSSAAVPAGYLPDFGQPFGDRGNGFSYGWDADITGDSRRRGMASDARYDTVVQMQEGGAAHVWEIELPTGAYTVFLACGDSAYNDQINTIDVEGTVFEDPDGRSNYDEYTGVITVTDGRLTIKPAPGGTKCKVLFVHITDMTIYKAYEPIPEDGASYDGVQTTLTWTAGDHAVSHNVYFGDNADDVLNGAAGTSQGNQLETEFTVGVPGSPCPEGLVPGTTYYWRVDEVNDLHPDSPWTGDLWSFSIPPWTARDPYPADGADFVHPEVVLTWTPGFAAQGHIVYLDADFEDVNTATGGVPQTEPNYTPVILAKDTTYYWRVDEFDGVNVHRGEVWSFKTIPYVPITDPNLLCWWKFDEVLGDTVTDYSGYDHFGTVHGATLNPAGRVGGALYFDGTGNYVVDETAARYLNGLDAITVAMWIKADQIATDRGFIDCIEPDGKDRVVTMRHDVAGASYGGVMVFKMGLTATLPDLDPNVVEVWQGQLESSSRNHTNQWQHVAMTWESGSPIRFFINGTEDSPSGRTDPNAASGVITDCTKLIIGKGGMDQGTKAGWKGMIDDVRIYNIALEAVDIKQVMRGESDLAWEPSPATTSTPDLKGALPLSWLPGENAAQHDVYFGTDQDAVANADASDTTGVYRGRQDGTSYTPPEGVQWGGGPYFWRIDEYNTDGTITRGRIWQFTVADFLIIDDFETYNDINLDLEGSNRIYKTWLDGWDDPTNNGSVVGYPDPDFDAGQHFVETTIIHGGRQSMPFSYDNSVARTSEATRALTYPRDWTQQNVKRLTLWFQGFPASFVEAPAGTYTLSATGADIGGLSDQFRFVYKQLSGPGSISAQVLSVQNTNEWSKAGVMIRRSLDPSAPYAAVYITPEYGCRFQGRLGLASDSTSDSSVATPEQNAIVAPYWVKIERDASDNFNGYYSADGVTWTPMSWNPQNIPMAADAYVGLALTSHKANAICVAQFANVGITGSATPATWTNEAVGIDMPDNDPAPMYLAAKSGTTRGVVWHDDPKAAQIDTWTQWDIDLTKFSAQGVNLSDVGDISIGFGDPTGPQTGGAGRVFFDDIHLERAE
jgi:hypothetical protein